MKVKAFYEGVEWCCYCNREFDFVFTPEKRTIKCTYCNTEQRPCSLCNNCNGDCNNNLNKLFIED